MTILRLTRELAKHLGVRAVATTAAGNLAKRISLPSSISSVRNIQSTFSPTHADAISDPLGFWAEKAEGIVWDKKWDTVSC